MTFKNRLTNYIDLINDALLRYLPVADTYPAQIHDAMHYSLFAGGKRLRPVLCSSVYSLFEEDLKPVLPVACALELIHTYSLIHDDLPCMDDDDFRRGMPTCHKKYGEAIAVLSGDALLTEAFSLIARTDRTDTVAELVRIISLACGSTGLIGGQVMDMLSENKAVDEQTLHYIHTHKTGVLITVSCQAGAACARADSVSIENIIHYGQALGLAFQISDDILDVVGSSEKLGKNVGQDQKMQKATYPALYGLDESRKRLNHAVEQALDALNPFGDKAVFLSELARFVAYRDC